MPAAAAPLLLSATGPVHRSVGNGRGVCNVWDKLDRMPNAADLVLLSSPPLLSSPAYVFQRGSFLPSSLPCSPSRSNCQPLLVPLSLFPFPLRPSHQSSRYCLRASLSLSLTRPLMSVCVSGCLHRTACSIKLHGYKYRLIGPDRPTDRPP